MIGLTVTWTVVFFFCNLLQCWPISVNWTGFGAATEQCIDTNKMYLAQAYSDVLLDVLILSLPVPCVWQLQMPVRHKIAVLGMFLLGVLTVGAAIAKLIVFHEIAIEVGSGDSDITWILSPAIYWPMVESSLGIVGACLPLIRPLVSNSMTSGFMRSMRSATFGSSAGSRTLRGSDNPYSIRLEDSLVGSAASTPDSLAVAKFDAHKGFRSELVVIDEQGDSL